MLEIGEDFLHSIQHTARTDCGYATIRDVTTMTLEDRMESFFLAETIKYLYLLFDPDNFIHNDGTDPTVVESPLGKCTVYAGGYIFNTEAHPIDPSALHCCTGVSERELHDEIQHIDEVPFSTRFQGLSKKNKKSKKGKGSRKLKSDTGNDEAIKLDLERDMDIEIDMDMLRTSQMNTMESCPAKNFVEEMRNIHKKIIRIPIESTTLQEPENPEDESMLERLLRRLFEEHSETEKQQQQDEKQKSDSKGKVSSPDQQKKNLKFVTLDEAERLQKMVKSFESNVKALKEKRGESFPKGQRNAPKASENRIRTASTSPPVSTAGSATTSATGERYVGPDLDLIFGTGSSSRSLSFYFSLKWLKSFPDLIKQLIPAEKFDVQAFYSRMSEQFSNENYAKEYNFSVDWAHDFNVLRCPRIGIPERFMFLRPSVEE